MLDARVEKQLDTWVSIEGALINLLSRLGCVEDKVL